MSIDDRDYMNNRGKDPGKDWYNPKEFRGGKNSSYRRDPTHQGPIYDEIYEVIEKKSTPYGLIFIVGVVCLILGAIGTTWIAKNPGEAIPLLHEWIGWFKRGLWIWIGGTFLIGLTIAIWKADWFDEFFPEKSTTGKIARFLNVKTSLVWLGYISLLMLLMFKLNG